MIKSIARLTSLLSLAIILISCNSSTTNESHENKVPAYNPPTQIDKSNIDSKTPVNSSAVDQVDFESKVSGFVEKLKSGEDLGSFFNSPWSFVYHEDNRCEGSTDGQIDDLSKTAIDSIISLTVKNDGDGWACDKKEPKTFNLEFDLKKKIERWDRFEIEDYEDQEEKIIYVQGAGESDYLKLHFNEKHLIITLAYRSEDPG